MPYDKMVRLLTQLRKKSEAGVVDWQPTSEDDTYQASFPNYTVRILERLARDEIDIVLQILNEEGRLIEEVSDPQLNKIAPFEGQAFGFMRDLHQMARRKAMKVDVALDQILSDLEQE